MMAADVVDAAGDFPPAETPEPIAFVEVTGDGPAIGDLPRSELPPFDLGGPIGVENFDGYVICGYPLPRQDMPSLGDDELPLPEDWLDFSETEFTDPVDDAIEWSDSDFTFHPDFPGAGGVEIVSWDDVCTETVVTGPIEVDWAHVKGCVIGFVPGIGIVPMTFRPGEGMVPDLPSGWDGELPESDEGIVLGEFDLIDEVVAEEHVDTPVTRSPRSAAFAEMGTMAAAAMTAQPQGNAADFGPLGNGRRRR